MLFFLVNWKLNKMVQIRFYLIFNFFQNLKCNASATAQLQMIHKTFHIPVSDKMRVARQMM